MNLKNLNHLERKLVLDGELLPRRAPIRKPSKRTEKPERAKAKKLNENDKVILKSIISFLKNAIKQECNPKEVALVIETKLNKTKSII